MYIPQKHLENLNKYLEANKVLIIYGARRCGKTTLLETFLKKRKEKYLFLNGEDIFVQKNLSSQSIEKLKNYIGKNKLLIIDEAQKINQIGLNLKLIVDSIPKIKIIVTGSSSFDLAGQIGEPLTGRKYTFNLFPLSQIEISTIENLSQTQANLENRLIYGSYPEIVINNDRQKNVEYLREIVNSYLYKDILELEGIRHSEKIVKLLQLLAFQIGKEVSHTELGTQLSLSKNTVEKYLDLLEKTFVIHHLTGFSRNLRKEISKAHRYYFHDNGIRNSLINNLNSLEIRDDIGMLWENYIIIERLKKQEYLRIHGNNYFWRTYDQREIDFVEERDGKIFGYEIKWGKKSTASTAKTWLETYKNSEYKVIDKNNYLEFIT